MSMWLIKNVHVVDPSQDLDAVCDVEFDQCIRTIIVHDTACRDQRISSDHKDTLGRASHNKENLTPVGLENPVQVIDGHGKYLFPGLVDVHSHLREPGREDKEDIASGARAAARGGFTTILCMANTQPVLDDRGLVEFVINQGCQAGGARVWPVAAVTKGLKGEELVNMVELHNAGAMAFSDDGRGIQSSHTMLLALQYAQLTGCPIISHCEDDSLGAGGSMRRGAQSARLGLKGIPSATESVMAARDILLTEEAEGKLHLAHMSTSATVTLLGWAKKQGIDVTGEVNPHHLIFCDEDIGLTDTALKVNPPLPSAADREVLIEALANGTIDMLATDHAPHTWEEKTQPFADAPFGINAFETALSALWMSLVEPGKLSLSQLVRAWSLNPARRFGLAGGSLCPGAPADIVLFDPKHSKVIGEGMWMSKSTNTPYWKKPMHGFAVATWVGGEMRSESRDIETRRDPVC